MKMGDCTPWPALLKPSRYHYRPLKNNHIRVLRLPPSNVAPDATLECEIIHVPLSNAAPYEALSYVWGSDALTRTIHVKAPGWHLRKETIPITESLWAALTHLQKPYASRDLWVDQLCINQNDQAEKSIQVDRMGEIYSRSTTTIIWLGPQNQKDAILLNELYMKLSKASSTDRDERGVLSMDQKTLAAMIGTSKHQEREDRMIYTYRRLLERFLALPWFSRVWVYQEAVLAKRVIVVWGKIILPFDFITGLIFSIYGLAKGSPDDQKWHKRIKDTKGFAPLRAIYYDRAAHGEGKLNFLHVLWHARKHLSAKDNRDYIYAFRGVNKHIDNKNAKPDTRIQDQMTPDYKASTTADVYTNLALTCIRTTHTLDILHYIAPTSPKGEARSGESRATAIPSASQRDPTIGICLPHRKQKPKREPPIRHENQDTSSLPSWVPDWSNRNFTCGGPIFDPQLPWPSSACSWKPWTPRPSPSLNVLPVSGYIVGRVQSILRHRFKHTYFSSSLKNALGLDNLVTLLKKKVSNLPQAPEWSSTEDKIRETALRTTLANGAFTLTHDIEYPIRDLLKAYGDEDGTSRSRGEGEEPVPISEGQQGVLKLRHHLRQSGEMATGKRVFLTEGLDIGLGYATVKKGDLKE
ncbi:hypothetical protein OQA88_7160 [Cercophora sp. LCS_1]